MSSFTVPTPNAPKESRKFDESIPMNEYKYVLLQKANIFHPPIIPKPMIRIVGFAYTEEEAEAIKRKILSHRGAKYIPLFIEPVDCLQMIGLTPKRHLDIECVKRKKEYVFEAHDSWNRKRSEMFEKRMDSKTKAADLGTAVEHRNKTLQLQKELQDAFPAPKSDDDMMFELLHYTGLEDSDKIEKHVLSSSSSSSSSSLKDEKVFSMDETTMSPEDWNELNYCLQVWPNDLIISDQHWVSITIIPDFSIIASNWIEAAACGNEPFYIIHTAAQTSEEIEKITLNRIWNRFQDADTLVHPMYKWMDFTTVFDENINTIYMDPELDNIMSGRNKERKIANRIRNIAETNKSIKKIDVTKVNDKNSSVLDMFGVESGDYKKNQNVKFGYAKETSETAETAATAETSETAETAEEGISEIKQTFEKPMSRSIDDILDELEKKEAEKKSKSKK